MLRLRVISPEEKTDDVVVRLIERTVGTAHLVMLRGAASSRSSPVSPAPSR
ncbi:hypothetical protein MBT84_17845 [Streptomyces sp. MBT84]|uniref:hypothetical protein n=1 Tax=unclassified Streptomyces TaxID=2593676 RepID=UPI001C6EB415|nr:hypothetical protein [Streptomyces sp. MBT84]MBW8701473.1 hypothetical protein [Streptomyces sp. MBT84]